ncbi:hypothetical protein T07_10754 [Trichinella nelsoni]|uniref:Uncharacterized protein n=1 Tax=Trichinella nelsoni TaxID=6336 RepID=A0A0V0SC03_9BILA|nr:hypothetical protein T07_10754 [Trichinella nelsoni]
MQSRGNKSSHPAQFKDAAGEDSGWLLATDCMTRQVGTQLSVVQQVVRSSLVLRVVRSLTQGPAGR